MKISALYFVQSASLLGRACALPTDTWTPSYDQLHQRSNNSGDPAIVHDIRPRQDVSTDAEVFLEALTDSEINTSDPKWAFINDEIGTWSTVLKGFEGCDGRKRKMIISGWQQSWKLQNMIAEEARNGINFNDGAAMEFLGPPAATHNLHDRWNKLFREDLSTVQAGPWWRPGWFDVDLKVRCDDWEKGCTSLVPAYTINSGKERGEATINFCPDYFRDEIISDLDKRMREGQAGEYLDRNNLAKYSKNRATVWIHELLHVLWITKQSRMINKIVDMFILYNNPTDGVKERRAYGPSWAKALARISNDRAGQLAWQNADNGALYVTAKYVQRANDNEYPYLPEHGAIPDDTRRPRQVGEMLFVNDDSTVTELDPAYLDLMDATASGLIRPLDPDDKISITEDVFSTADYPAEYLAQRLVWARQQLPSLLPLAGTSRGRPVAGGTDLRILTVGDSITVGYLSNQDGGDGNGYRLKLRENMPYNKVVYAGTSPSSWNIAGNYYAAWSGKTIQYIYDNIDSSLAHNPNLVLLAAGMNDMNSDAGPGHIANEGNDPSAAANRLGKLIDKIHAACPDAVILVAKIINVAVCGVASAEQYDRTIHYGNLIPGVVEARKQAGVKVQAVDFQSNFGPGYLRPDCVHPTNDGYRKLGDLWYDFIEQIPSAWFNSPEGPDPEHTGDVDSGANGGIDQNIPPPNWGPNPIVPGSISGVRQATNLAGNGGNRMCNAKPHWQGTGQIALGFGSVGTWQWNKLWTPASTIEEGPLADGLHLDPRHVRLADMNGDGKADYVWVNPETGETICWLNNLPNPWSPAGTNGGIIASGLGPGARVYFADLNGDRRDDYIFVDPDHGSLDVYWNRGHDDSWSNGWKFERHPGPDNTAQLAVGVPHANLATLRFPDINGDGRADYVYIGEGGALGHWLNTGSEGGTDVVFQSMGGIATGAGVDISRVVFADMNGDGRDDYLVWDESKGRASLSGFLNQETRNEGVPVFIDLGGANSVADGIDQPASSIRLADMNGDGFDDYVFVDDTNGSGALWVWWNDGGVGQTHMQIDGLHFADIDGDGLDDYIYMEPVSGAPTVFLNKGPSDADSLGWSWAPLNNAQPIASGAGRASTVVYGDIDGDGKDDYLTLDPITGALKAYLNKGPSNTAGQNWDWFPIGQIADGFGVGFPGANVRIADIDGDGKDDYIYLHSGGATTIYRNKWAPGASPPFFEPLPSADAAGPFQRAEEISFADIDGDGKADYVWTQAYNGAAFWYKNNYPNTPAWLPMGEIAGGVGTSGQTIRYATLQHTARASYVAVNPTNGAIAAWLNGCDSLGPLNGRPVAEIIFYRTLSAGAPLRYIYQWKVVAETPQDVQELCRPTAAKTETAANIDPHELPIPFPPIISDFNIHGFTGCTYNSLGHDASPGTLSCPGRDIIQCTENPRANDPTDCGTNAPTFVPKVQCRF